MRPGFSQLGIADRTSTALHLQQYLDSFWREPITLRAMSCDFDAFRFNALLAVTFPVVGKLLGIRHWIALDSFASVL
jgi:hypothetical protein